MLGVSDVHSLKIIHDLIQLQGHTRGQKRSLRGHTERPSPCRSNTILTHMRPSSREYNKQNYGHVIHDLLMFQGQSNDIERSIETNTTKLQATQPLLTLDSPEHELEDANGTDNYVSNVNEDVFGELARECAEGFLFEEPLVEETYQCHLYPKVKVIDTTLPRILEHDVKVNTVLYSEDPSEIPLHSGNLDVIPNICHDENNDISEEHSDTKLKSNTKNDGGKLLNEYKLSTPTISSRFVLLWGQMMRLLDRELSLELGLVLMAVFLACLSIGVYLWSLS